MKCFHIIKAIPPKHPIQRLDSLERFAKEWLSTAFGFASKRTQHWSDKFTRNTERMRKRWEICGRDSEAPEGILIKKPPRAHFYKSVSSGFQEFPFQQLFDERDGYAVISNLRFSSFFGV